MKNAKASGARRKERIVTSWEEAYVGDRKLIKERLRIRTVRGTFKEEVR